jgi:hypothetical protein
MKCSFNNCLRKYRLIYRKDAVLIDNKRTCHETCWKLKEFDKQPLIVLKSGVLS